MGTRIRVWGAALGVAGALVVGAASAQGAKKTATFTITTVQSGPGGQVTIHSKVWITPTQGRVDVTDPINGEQKIFITNGFYYQFDPKAKEAVKAPLPPALKKSQDNFAFLLTQFAFDVSGPMKIAKKVRTETVSGYPCDVYATSKTQEDPEAKTDPGKNRGSLTVSITVWKPQSAAPDFPIKVVHNAKLVKPDATMDKTITITLSDIKLNGPIPPSVFAVPTGYKYLSGPAAKKKARK
jgi:outer membrane lipoprotein-sorting protein